MEEQPSFDSGSSPEPVEGQRAEAFHERLVKTLGGGILGALVYMVVLGPRNLVGVSNGLFVIGAILLLIGLMPLVSEIFSRATISSRLRDRNLDDVLDEQRKRSQQGERLTFLFGASGMIMVILSFVVAFL